jgi:hypothetical protein
VLQDFVHSEFVRIENHGRRWKIGDREKRV